MKTFCYILLCLLMVAGTASAQYSTPNYMEQGGASWVIGSTGTLTVASGGTLTIASGATFTNNASSALATLDVGGGFTTGTGSGLTVSAAGALSTNGAIISETTITSGKSTAAQGGFTAYGGTSGGIAVTPIATGTALTTIQNQNVAAAVITLPSATCTLPGLGLANAFTAANTFTTENSSATPSAAQRTIIGTINVGTTTAITGVTNDPSFAAIRGIANVGDISGTGQPYTYGVQGKLAVGSGKTINNAALWATGVYAQLDVSAGTYTAGQIAGLWVDMGATGNASAKSFAPANMNCIRITNTVSGMLPKAIISVTANATNFLDLSAADGVAGWLDATTGGTTATGRIRILVDGATRYLHVFSD